MWNLRIEVLGRMQLTAAVSLALGCLIAPIWALDRVEEIKIPPEILTKVDAFELNAFNKAEALFAKGGQWKAAMAAYDAFCLEYSKSEMAAFALIRRGRCLEMINTRNDAIRQYEDVVIYYPNSVAAAAAALFYKGNAQVLNGEEEKAKKTWAKLANDPEYSRHPLAATALFELAKWMRESNKPAEAVEFFQKIAIQFRESNVEAFRNAVQVCTEIWVKDIPSEEKLRALYAKVGGFDHRARTVADPGLDLDYWRLIQSTAQKAEAKFTDVQLDQRRVFCQYWGDRMSKCPTNWDDIQITAARFLRVANSDEAAWIAKLDDLYKKHQKPGDDTRTFVWMKTYHAGGKKAKVLEYYNKIDLNRAANQVLQEVMFFFYQIEDIGQAKATATRIRTGELKDDQIEHLCHALSRYDLETAFKLQEAIKDKERGLMLRLSLGSRARDQKVKEQVLSIADELKTSTRYSGEAAHIKGGLLAQMNRHAEAIEAYRRSNRVPDNGFLISQCYVKMGKLDQAVSELVGIETTVPNSAPRAAYAIANLFKDAGEAKKPLAIKWYRKIVNSYKNSPEQSQAHQILQNFYKVDVTGGAEAGEVK